MKGGIKREQKEKIQKLNDDMWRKATKEMEGREKKMGEE